MLRRQNGKLLKIHKRELNSLALTRFQFYKKDCFMFEIYFMLEKVRVGWDMPRSQMSVLAIFCQTTSKVPSGGLTYPLCVLGRARRRDGFRPSLQFGLTKTFLGPMRYFR